MSQLNLFHTEKTLFPNDIAPHKLEECLREQGFSRIVGVDEAGRGPLAGPVVAACCVLPGNEFFPDVTDSKLLSETEREKIYAMLTTRKDIEWHVAFVAAQVIDQLNIRKASLLAMKLAVEKLVPAPDYVLIDGRDTLDLQVPQKAVIKGDLHCQCVAAASIIAKVTRDRYMRELAKKYHMYHFEKNKGYGTEAHLDAISKHGVTDHHRKSFAPIRNRVIDPKE